MRTTTMLLLAVLGLGTGQATAQSVGATTTAPSSDFSINYGNNVQYPAAYDRYRSNPYALSPYLNPAVVVPLELKRPQVPAMQPYTDLEYGQIVQESLQATPLEVSSAKATTASIILQAESTGNGLPTGTAAAGVLDVMDRGTMILDTYEEIRLRGVAMPSVNDRDEVVRYYARTGADAIRRLTRDRTVYIKLGNPERDNSGLLLAEVFLEDGSMLNRQVLEMGFGRFDTQHYAPGEIPVTLQAAELRARESKQGIFSKN